MSIGRLGLECISIVVYPAYSSQLTKHREWTATYIFFKDRGDLQPGKIDMLFGIKLVGGREEHFAAVCKNLPIAEGTEDPFCLYADFGVGLWREDYANDLCYARRTPSGSSET